MEQPHREISSFLNNWNKRKKMLLLPRGSLKTTLGTISNCIFEILDNPNIRILIASETLNQAIKFLSEIKGHFEKEEFQVFYGDLRKEVGWKESEITVNSRTENKKEPTISTAGIDVTRTGMHYDLIIVDDPHSQKNVSNREQIEQVKTWYRLLLSMLEPEGHILLMGTRWDFEDLYGMIERELTNEYEILIHKAIENGKLFYPARLTFPFLEEQKKEQGEYIFSMQYLLEPIPSEKQIFKEENIKFFSEIPNDLQVYASCDPSLTEDEKEKGDFTAIIVLGIDTKNNWYLLELINEKLSPDQINQKLMEVYLRWKPVKIGIESVAFSKLLKPSFEKYMREKNLFPRVIELKSGGRSKELRMKSLQPFYEQERIFMPKPDFLGNDAWAILYSQLIHFPKLAHDDCLDALAYISDMIPYRQEEDNYEVSVQKFIDHQPGRSKPAIPGAQTLQEWREYQRQAVSFMDD